MTERPRFLSIPGELAAGRGFSGALEPAHHDDGGAGSLRHLHDAGSLGAFYVMAGAWGRFPTGPYFAIFALPCVLFLVSGLLARRRG
jgi:hypothetical protein